MIEYLTVGNIILYVIIHITIGICLSAAALWVDKSNIPSTTDDKQCYEILIMIVLFPLVALYLLTFIPRLLTFFVQVILKGLYFLENRAKPEVKNPLGFKALNED